MKKALSSWVKGCVLFTILAQLGDVTTYEARADDPQDCVPAPPGLVGWWRADGNTFDSAATNRGTIEGDVTYESGEVDQAFSFDGTNDVVALGNPSVVRLQDLTIECWIRRSSTNRVSQDDNAALVAYGSGGYSFFMSGDSMLQFGKSYVDSIASSAAVTDTNYHHVAVTKSGSTVFIYLDGAAYPLPPYNSVFVFSTSIGIGGPGSSALGASFLGAIDDVAIYNRALSSNEIRSIYLASSSGKCPSPPFIVIHPMNQNIVMGNPVTFDVSATGAAPLNYQWRFNGTNITDATNASYTIASVQIARVGNYSVRVTNSLGSAVSSNALLTVTFPPAVIRALDTNVMGGAPVTVPITLAANGNENTLGLSINFSTQRLAFAGIAWGGGVAGANSFVNTNQAVSGRVGMGVSFPPGTAFTPQTQTVATLTFNALPLPGASPVNTTISFGDQPVLRELYDTQLHTLSASYISGTVSISPTVFESDVFPRTNGNQAVTTTDLAQLGRFVARLDSAVGQEFQRADCAPKTTSGDGQMKVTDLVQAGRYVAGFDDLAALGGPASEIAPVPIGSSGSRQLSVTGTNIFHEESAEVSVIFDAQGNENAVGFTIAFNPTAVGYGGLNLGSGAVGASLTANNSEVSFGRLGVVLTLPSGNTFIAGTRELVKVTFVASPNVAGPFQVDLTDQLVTRCVSDPSANELPVGFVGGIVTINPLNPNPRLVISRSSNNVVLSWPLWASDFVLQASGNIGTGVVWTNVSAILQTNGSTVFTPLQAGNKPKFFRLDHP